MAAPRLEKTALSARPRKGSWLVSLYALCLLLAVFTLDQQGLFNLPGSLVAERGLVYGHHQYWRAFTGPLLHADLGHLASNAVFFTGLGYLLYGYFGPWVFPALSFFAGGAINLAVLWAYPPEVEVVGASGIVYFMAAFWLALYFFVERGRPPVRRLVNVLAFSLVLLFPELFEERVSYLSHAVGYALGLAAGAGYFGLRRGRIRAQEVWRDPEPPKEESEPWRPEDHQLLG